MSGLLRAAAGALRTGLASGSSAAARSGVGSGVGSSSGSSGSGGRQQARGLAHDLHVKKNKFVEGWIDRRENIENEFSWTPETVRGAVVWLALIPAAMYGAVVWSAHSGARAVPTAPLGFCICVGGGGLVVLFLLQRRVRQRGA